MSVLVDYVQPLTDWLQQHPHWALFITFFISLTESLAIIGSIVPGSVTMTAIGILAGSGIMRVDLTMLAAILGAVAGDSLSYALGYIYSDRLTDIWPFTKYPKVVEYGKDFFKAHGGKSVLIGRFVGPLRSIIPVIAGVLHMKQWRFLIANVVSAVGWSFLYVMPGVVIGAASHELSAESATRLFVMILIILAGIWLLSLMLKWLVIKLNSYLRKNLHNLWSWLLKSYSLAWLCKALTPKKEQNHYTTASLSLIALFCGLCFIILTILTWNTPLISSINLPVHLFVQSFHTYVLEAFFIFCTQLTSKTTMATLFVVCCFWFVYNKKPKVIFYLSSLIIFSVLFALLCQSGVNNPRPTGLLVLQSDSSFPVLDLLVATAFYGFILFYINSIYLPFTNALRTFVFTVLALSGAGTLYLGDHWLTDIMASYFAGAAICLIYCLIYRKSFAQKKVNYAPYVMCSLVVALFTATLVTTYTNYRTMAHNHTPYRKEFALSEAAWWNQEKPLLPIYRLNRIGKRISTLNLQYSGSLSVLEEHLASYDWTLHTETFFNNLVTWLNNQSTGMKFPLLTQLYENKAPSLIMTYEDPDTNLALELRVWESNYNLTEYNRPLWIGSIHALNTNSKKMKPVVDPLNYLHMENNPFSVRKVSIPENMLKTTMFPTQPYIILLKE